MSALQQGDVVRLRSGGPPMLVTQLGQDGGRVVCAWVDQGALRLGSLPPAALKRVLSGAAQVAS